VIGMSGANVQQTVVEELRPGAEPAVTLHQLTVEQNVWGMLLKRNLATLIPVQLTVSGVIGMNGANVQQTVVEELRLGAEPAVTLHQLTVEQNVWEMLLKHSLATPTLVRLMVIGVIGVSGANVQQTVAEELRLGAEPAVALHQLTVEQNVWGMLLKSSLATTTPVQGNTQHVTAGPLSVDIALTWNALSSRISLPLT